MIRKMCTYVTENLIQAEKINEEQKELYQYGFERVILNIINVITTLVIGLLMKQILECILLQFLFNPLRSNAGGYHAANAVRCYVLSAIVTIAMLLGLRFLPGYFPSSIALCFLLLLALIIAIIAPVGSPNKPLDDLEKKVYGYRTRLILSVEVILGILSYLFSYSDGLWLITINIVTISVSLIAGIIVIRRKEYIS